VQRAVDDRRGDLGVAGLRVLGDVRERLGDD
jgi:hypothetical protein